MKPAAAATLPAAIRLTPKKRRRRYSHGWIRRCRPGRGGVSHHPRRRFQAVLSLGAFIGMPPVGCDAGHPIIYQSDITLISSSSMVAVIRWRSWHRWTAVCLLAYIYLAVAVAVQRQHDAGSDLDTG